MNFNNKCTSCCIGSGLDCYYDYGGEYFLFEDCINTDKNALKLDVLNLFNYCPYCGHKNNLSKFKNFVKGNLKDYVIGVYND